VKTLDSRQHGQTGEHDDVVDQRKNSQDAVNSHEDHQDEQKHEDRSENQFDALTNQIATESCCAIHLLVITFIVILGHFGKSKSKLFNYCEESQKFFFVSRPQYYHNRLEYIFFNKPFSF
jgi:pyruvate kinase